MIKKTGTGIRQAVLGSFLSLALMACSDYGFEKIENFDIEQDKVENNQVVDVIYSPGGPDDNQDRQYFFQYVVVGLESHDTFRILTPDRYDFSVTPKRLNYISITSEDPMDKIANETANAESWKGITKVAYLKAYKTLGTFNFPTVYGQLAVKFNINEMKDSDTSLFKGALKDFDIKKHITE